jgi:hypothetical protein
MHGKSGTVMILNLTPMSEEDQEQDRLRDASASFSEDYVR